MALQTSGQISMSNIANEKGETLSNVSLSTLSTTSINTDPCNPTNPNNGAPYATSEFYGYDHNCVTEPGLFEISMYGLYRSGEEGCDDQGRRVEEFAMYSNCEPFAIDVGCSIFADPEGNELWRGDGWYFYKITATTYFISRGEIVDKLACFK